MAQNFTSVETKECFNRFYTFYAGLQSRSMTLNNLFVSLHLAVEDLWQNMINDQSTKLFYKKLHEDIELLSTTASETERKVLLETFAEMLETNTSVVESSVDDLPEVMNADIVMTTMQQKKEEIENFITAIQSLNDVNHVIAARERFIQAAGEMEENLSSFLEESKIGHNFYK